MIRELQQKVKKPDQAQRSYMVREESLMDNPTGWFITSVYNDAEKVAKNGILLSFTDK